MLEVGETIDRPKELTYRIGRLLDFWGTKTLGDVTRKTCADYVEQRGKRSQARRELEDLRAAANHYAESGKCAWAIKVYLPAKPPPRVRWLTRKEAALLVRAAWRYRERQKGVATDRATRQHLARFILVGLYTGTRSGAICNAALQQSIGRGWVDLANGIFYRRGLDVAETKKRQPTINLPPRLLAHMRRWAAKGISTKAVIEFNGEPVKSVRKAFARACADVGLKDVMPHTLRHSAASWAMQNHADIFKTADYLGMTPETLRTVYGHLDATDHHEVGDAITGNFKRRSSFHR